MRQVSRTTPAPGIVSLRVTVNEQANCAGVDGLTITATIAEGARIISTQQTDFADSSINFESLAGGDYICSVSIGDGTESIESMQIPCVAAAGKL